MGCSQSQHHKLPSENLKLNKEFRFNKKLISDAFLDCVYFKEQNVSQADLEKLIEAMTTHEYKSGVEIFKEGEKNKSYQDCFLPYDRYHFPIIAQTIKRMIFSSWRRYLDLKLP